MADGPAAAVAERSWPRPLSSLRHRNFRLFWTGQLVSLVGTWMQSVAQGWLVLQLTNDPLALGIVAAAQFTPVLVFGLFGGVVADVVPKRRTLLVAQAWFLGLALALGLLVLSGRAEPWHVYVLAILFGLGNAVEMPVRQSFVVEMVGRADIANAVALNSAVFNGARIVGPAIAGLLIASVGLASCFLLNALSYAAALAGLLLIRPAELMGGPLATIERSAHGLLDPLVEGLAYVRRTPIVLLPITDLGVSAAAGANFSVLIPVLARDVLAGSSDTYGFLLAASGLGSLLAAISVAFGQRPTLRLLVAGGLIFGLGLIGLGVSRHVLVDLVLMALVGWGLIAMAMTANTLIQLTVPDELRGRVMSVYTTVFAGSTPIGGLFAGAIAAVAGVPVALIVGGVVSVLTALAAAVRIPALAPARTPAGAGQRTR